MIALSVLDVVPVREGSTLADAMAEAPRLARAAEEAGYARYWVAEHHGMPGIAGAATSVVLAHVGHATRTIRLGAGGIMLPNHNPFVIAEQFGALDAMFPGRIDLGLGRAPGADSRVAQMLHKDIAQASQYFPQDVVELAALFAGDPRLPLQATPGRGAAVAMWILGSSLFGASLAAHLGLPYAFASHFAPRQVLQAIELYRSQFRPSAQLAEPYVVIGIPLIAAPTDDEAEYLASSNYQRVLGILTGNRRRLQPPIENFMAGLRPEERAAIGDFLAAAVIGGPERVHDGLSRLAEITGADEFMLVCDVFDPDLRLRSLDIAAAAMKA